jgi:hypothetical protein
MVIEVTNEQLFLLLLAVEAATDKAVEHERLAGRGPGISVEFNKLRFMLGSFYKSPEQPK